jgi:hypothetical protein
MAVYDPVSLLYRGDRPTRAVFSPNRATTALFRPCPRLEAFYGVSELRSLAEGAEAFFTCLKNGTS